VLRRDLAEGELNVSTGQKLIYTPDQLGSVRDVLDATTGNLVQSYDYTPYGAVARSNGSTPTDYQYAGLFAHPQSGLNFGTYRVQDGVTGRFLNRDLVRELAGPNLYSYVMANPVNWIDPLGLWPFGAPRSGFNFMGAHVPSYETVISQLSQALIKSGVCNSKGQADTIAKDIVDAIGWGDLGTAQSINNALNNGTPLTPGQLSSAKKFINQLPTGDQGPLNRLFH
jgi:RHS repeat-associated protein